MSPSVGKGPNLSTIDIESDQQVDLYNPRSMVWNDHFEIHDGCLVGITSSGRGTVRLLDVNSKHRLQHRRELIAQGEFDVN